MPTMRDNQRRGAEPSICFVALEAYGQLAARADLAHIGGAEVQWSLVGRELARRGTRVSFVCWDYGQPDGVEHDGVRVFKTCNRDAGLRGVRFVYPRMTALWGALARADADVYFHRTADSETGLVAAWTRRRGRAFVFSVASDTDCERSLPRLAHLRQRALYRYGLRRADRVIAQTTRQQRLLREQFDIAAILVPPCGAAPDGQGSAGPPRPTGRLETCSPDAGEAPVVQGMQAGAPAVLGGAPAVQRRVLWLGRFSEVKRLELCYDVARLCPELAFDVVGDGNRGSAYEARLRDEGARIANVRMHGRVPHAQVGRFYDVADALLCTSQWEGFPNTFLEAWSRGIPTVSTVEPDDVISRHRLGAVAADAPGLASALRRLLDDEDGRRDCGRRAREHFNANHGVERAVDAYLDLIEELQCRQRTAASVSLSS